MPETIRALIYILLLSSFAFLLIKKQAEDQYIISYKIFRRCWYIFTVLAFLSHSYLIFAFFSIVLLIRESLHLKLEYSVPVFFLLLLTLPTLSYIVPGFGGIQYILEINWPRILTIFYLLIIYITNNSRTKQIKINTDKFVLILVLYLSALSFRDTTFTDGLRDVLYNFLDIYIPYIVISRLTTNLQTLNNTFFAIYTSIFIMALIAIFETFKSWHVYTPLNYSLDVPVGPITDYKYRLGLLRAYTAFGAIHLGMLIVVTLTISFYLFKKQKLNLDYLVYYLILILGLFSTLSRGPWVAYILVIALYYLLVKNNILQWIKLITSGFLVFSVLVLTDFGKAVIDLLPVIGSDNDGNISYRERLLQTSLEVIAKNPFFGSTDYANDPLMQNLIQGEGIIDIVNTYLQISLEYGLIGFFLFVTIFVSVLININNVKKLSTNNNMVLISNIFLVSIFSIMFVIATVSTLGAGTVNVFYWAYIGLAIGYVRLANKPSFVQTETNTI